MLAHAPLAAPSRQLALLGLLTLLAATTGCSLRYDFSSECAAPQDCQRFDQPGVFYTCEAGACAVDPAIACRQSSDCMTANATCTAQGECVAMTPDMMPDMPVDMPDGMDDMTSDMDMSDAATDMPPDMPMPQCTLNSECIAELGDTGFCDANGQCLDALDASGDCQRVYYSRTANPDNVVFIGSLLPLTEPFGSLIGRPLENAIQLAVDTINDDGGLAGGRKIAWISCDSKGNAQVAQRAAAHLAQRVGTPAIIGPLFSEEFIATVSNVTNSADVFAITPTSTSPSVRNQRQGKNLVWRNIAADEFQAYGIAERVRFHGPSRVLILYKNDKYGEDLQDLVFNQLRNEFSGNALRVIQLPNPIDLADPSPEGITQDYAMRIGQVVQKGVYEPQLVIIIGTNEGAAALSAYLGATQPQQIAAPRFILSHGVVPAMADLGAGLNAQGAGALLPLIEGVAPDILDVTSPIYAEYLRKYTIAFESTQPALASTTTFDAVMTIALAMATLDADEVITGPKIADGIARLTDKDGTRVSFFDAAFVSNAVNALQAGDNIDMVGVSGELDYDITRGEVYTPVVGWRIAQDGEGQFIIEEAREMTFPNAPALAGAEWSQ